MRRHRRLTAVQILFCAAVLSGTPFSQAAEGQAEKEKPVELARRTYELLLAEYRGRQLSDPEKLHLWSLRWMEEEAAISQTDTERVNAIRGHLNRMREVEGLAVQFVKSGRGTQSHVAATKYYRLKAEARLASDHHKAPPGTFSGVVRLHGQLPVLPPLVKKGQAVRDSAVCAATADIPNEQLIVDPKTRGIANVFIYLRRRPADAKSSESVPTETLVFTRKDCRSLPHAMLVRVGQKLIVKNGDPVNHSVKTLPRFNQQFNVTLGPGQTTQLVYRRAEPVPLAVQCNIHSWIRAYHLPLDHPFAAVTDSQGRFTIKGLPPGVHSFIVWHESTGILNTRYQVEVKPDIPASVELSFLAENSKLRPVADDRPANSEPR